MPRYRTDIKTQPFAEYSHACDVMRCPNPGEYKAPRSRASLRQYIWLCLDHVKEYNKAWDYFDGMNTEQIEAFRKEAVTGHRPTWKTSGRAAFRAAALEESLHHLLDEKARKPEPVLSRKERESLAVLEFDQMPKLDELKKRYKHLVKRTHPDLNRDNEDAAAERFRRVTQAYKILMQNLSKSL